MLVEAREAWMGDPALLRRLKKGWHEQVRWHEDLPDGLGRNPLVTSETAELLQARRSSERVVESVRHSMAQADQWVSLDYAQRVRPLVIHGARAAGALAAGVDAVDTGRHTAELLGQDNLTGAVSAIEHYGSRNLGMVGGAALGAQIAGVAGMESGPFDAAFTLAGGVVGAVTGDKLADLHDQHAIYNQTDGHGHTWHLDRQRPEKGWTQEVPSGVDGDGPGRPLVGYALMPMRTTTLQADPALAGRLTFQANNTAVELALKHPATPRDPYTQPPAAHDADAWRTDPWRRDAASGTWSRTIDVALEHGIRQTCVHTATPQRAAELDAAAQATVHANLDRSRRGIAEHYAANYVERRWQRYGPMPAAVMHALHAPTDILEASDGHLYRRDAKGQWISADHGHSLAEGNLRAELDATARLREKARAMPHPSAAVAAPPALPPVPMHLRDFRHPGHPLHANYGAMLDHVHALEQRHGIAHGDHSERAAAVLTDRQSAGRLGMVARIELRGEGRDVAMHLVTRGRTFGDADHTTSISVFDAVAQPVEAVSRDWSRRELPHLYQVRAPEPDVPASVPHALDAFDARRPDHPRHAQFDALRERIGAAYAQYGIVRSADQLDRATAAVMLDVTRERPRGNMPDDVHLVPDPHTGRIGPQSGVLTRDSRSLLPGIVVTQASAMHQAAETTFQQLTRMAQVAPGAPSWAPPAQQAIARQSP